MALPESICSLVMTERTSLKVPPPTLSCHAIIARIPESSGRGKRMTSDDVLLSKQGAKRTLLVVEDNEINRMMLCAVLEQDFYIVEAEDGLVGLEKLAERYQDISLILLDVYMPRCDGFEFLRRKGEDERYNTVPVIVTTAGGSVEDEIRCLELGANDFVVKPYNFEIIENRVNNLIRLRESAMLVNMLTWDADTGLYNKEFFYRAVVDESAHNPGIELDFVIADVENAPTLNDRYGEAHYAVLLRELADQILRKLPKGVIGGRIGPDKLAFVVPHEQVCNWEERLSLGPENLSPQNVSVKFGVVEHMDMSLSVPKVSSLASSAAATIRGRYDVRVAVFDDELHNRQLLEETIRESMESALGDLQFSVFYQPKHDVHTHRVGGAEALVRWFHPTVGFISPGLFIPIFERNGFITRLDMYVWEQACKEVSRCQALGLPEVPISVNASRLDFDLRDLPQRLAAIADKYEIPHSLLHVELTETAYADNPQRVVDTLGELKKLGFSIELDDFGSGYSSLVSLNTLPLDVMKLDMSMVRKATELNDFRIVESTINLAQVLGLQTVVEGVETTQEARRVIEIGCDYIQGYYYAKPLSREEFEDYLRRDATGECDE